MRLTAHAEERLIYFTALQSNGFPPEDFLLTEEEHSASLNHRTTQYCFTRGVGECSVSDPTGACRTFPYRVFSSPGSERLQELHHYTDWNDVVSGVHTWIMCLTTELTTSDLWSSVSGDTQLIRIASDQDNRPFTPDRDHSKPGATRPPDVDRPAACRL